MEQLKEDIIEFILKNNSSSIKKDLELLTVTQLVIIKTQLELMIRTKSKK